MSAAKSGSGSGLVNRFLNVIESVGNRLPDPAVLFVILMVLTWGLSALLAPIARSAAHVVTDVEPARLRLCAAADCETWFIDTSKGGRRRWCSMARCGNRTKAARHRRRTRGRAGS